MTSGIYLLKNTLDGKCYVGQSWDVEKRWNSHSGGYNDCVISRAIQKHGWGNFEASVLAEVTTQQDMDRLEIEYIAQQDCLVPKGYNLLSGGLGGQHHETTKQKISKANKGRKATPETLAKMSQARTGVPKKKGYKLSEETRARMSAAKVGNTNTLGFKHTEESKAKMVIASTGRPGPQKGKAHSDEVKQKISNALKGRPKSEEAVKNMRESQKGGTMSEDGRRRVSEAMKARRAREKAEKAAIVLE